jgi:hypothetical protein
MTPYRISINNAHNFHAFNFRTDQSVRKYFNNEIFAIYGTCTCSLHNVGQNIFLVRIGSSPYMCTCTRSLSLDYVIPPPLQTVPYGVLCFFSSYKMLDKLAKRWQVLCMCTLCTQPCSCS